MAVTCALAHLTHTGQQVTAGQRAACVSEDRLHQIANALWVLSSFLTMRGNSAVTRLAQGGTESTGGKGIRASEG
jgi:hypothetical protein